MFNLPADSYIVYGGIALAITLLIAAVVFFVRSRKTVTKTIIDDRDDGVTVGSLPTPIVPAGENVDELPMEEGSA